jgi:hypothetical protein
MGMGPTPIPIHVPIPIPIHFYFRRITTSPFTVRILMTPRPAPTLPDPRT